MLNIMPSGLKQGQCGFSCMEYAKFPYLRTLSCAQSRKLGGVDENLHSERRNLEWVKFKKQSKHFQFKS